MAVAPSTRRTAHWLSREPAGPGPRDTGDQAALTEVVVGAAERRRGERERRADDGVQPQAAPLVRHAAPNFLREETANQGQGDRSVNPKQID